jgi:hypothetical protein
VFCFLNNRRTGVFFRMLFLGMLIVKGFSLPGDGMPMQVAQWLVNGWVLLAMLVVLADAAGTRRELTDKEDTTKEIIPNSGSLVFVGTALLSNLAAGAPYRIFPVSAGIDYLNAALGFLYLLAVVQFFKRTPRLLMMTAGTVMLMSLSEILIGGIESLLPLAAGVLPAAYLLVLFGKQARTAQPVRRGMIFAAGVLACVSAVFQLLSLAASYTYFGLAMFPYVLFAVGLAAFCLIKTRPDGVLFRLMFAGWPWMLPAIVTGLGMTPGGEYPLMELVGLVVMIACLMLVYSEAVKTKGDMESFGEIERMEALEESG